MLNDKRSLSLRKLNERRNFSFSLQETKKNWQTIVVLRIYLYRFEFVGILLQFEVKYKEYPALQFHKIDFHNFCPNIYLITS